ncbi:MAG: right-handed parallel beta-helix repeat-containing protein [Terracidiphilus sp.]
MRFQDAYLSNTTRVFVCLNLFVTTASGALGQSIEPSQCVRPTVTQPAALAMTPMNPSLPAGTLNVLQMGAVGNGTTDDTGVIQSIIDSNPNSTIYFPMGLYLLHNENMPGLQFQNFHGTAVMQSGARFLCDTIETPTAGSCIRIVNSSNATIGNFDIGYIGDSALPFPRPEAGNTAMLVEDSQNITLNNTTIEHSPGPGIWVDTSSNIQFLGGTSVNNTTADGLHFDNVGSAVVNGFFAQNTGDDAFEWDNDSTGAVYCGLNASNLQIYRSLSSGIAVRGGCGATFSNFYIDTTANSGLMVGQDPNFDTLVPDSNTFTNGKVLSSGRYSSPVVSGKDCIDVTASQGATFNNVACVYPLIDGASINGGANAVTMNGVTVDAAPNVGFVVGQATNVWFTNTISRSSAGGGYVFIGPNWGSVNGAYACNSGVYGYYHAGTSNFAESDLTSYDSSEGNSMNRAWWAENGSSHISLNGISLIDNETSNPIVVGETGGDGTITINGVSLDSPLTSFLLQLL